MKEAAFIITTPPPASPGEDEQSLGVVKPNSVTPCVLISKVEHQRLLALAAANEAITRSAEAYRAAYLSAHAANEGLRDANRRAVRTAERFHAANEGLKNTLDGAYRNMGELDDHLGMADKKISEQAKAITALEAERERLRGALSKIADGYDQFSIRRFARAALNTTTPD